MSENEYWSNIARRRLSRRRLLVRTGAVAIAGLWAGSTISCGRSTTSQPTAAARSTVSSQATAKPQPTIQRGGKLRFAFGLDATTLDPHTSLSGGDGWYTYAMYDNLVAYDQNYVVRPELSLAESWELPDSTTMIFKLRKGVKFHDGTPFNAQAVKYNIERVLDPKTKSLARTNFAVIDRVDVVDDSTAKFVLKQPSGALLSLLGDRGGAMVSRTAVEKYGDDFGVHPVGTGPFQFVEAMKGSYVSMKRNPDYWGKDQAGNQLPYLDEVKIMYIPDTTVSLANLQTGDADICTVLPKDLDTVKKNKNLGVQDVGGGISSLFSFNITKTPMDDVNLRLAMAYAVDPVAINNAVYFGDAIVAKAGMWPPGTWVYNESVPRPTYDTKKAKEYLAKAGKPNGFSVTLLTYQSPTLVQQTEMIKAQLAEVGINATIEVREVGPATSSFFTDGAFAAFSTSWARQPEPDIIASSCYSSQGFYNPSKVKNEQLDSLISKGASTYDIEERKKIYNQINEIVLGQALFVPFLYGRGHAGYNIKVQNMETFYGGDAMARFKTLWIKQ